MTKDSVTSVLRSLATGDKNRSETARLRDIMDEVENALTSGVSRLAILEALNEQGFTMTIKSFESALYRIRKKRTRSAEKISYGSHFAPCNQSVQTPQQSSKEPQVRIMNPADIRKSRHREIDLDDLTDKE